MRRAVLAAVLACAVLTAGCVHGQPEKRAATATPSGSARYADGERTPASVRDACTAVTKKSLAGLALHGAPRHEFGPNTCNWGDPLRVTDHVLRDLRVTAGAVAPTGHGTATAAATRAFDRLRGFDGDRKHNRDVKHPVSVRDLGDEAKLARRWDHSPKHLAVSLMVRTHNVIVTVELTEDSSFPGAYRRIGPQAALEAGVLAAAKDVLGRVGGASPAPTASPSPTYASGEIRRVRDVCRAVDSAVRLVPGAASREIAPAHTTVERGCYREAARGPSLVVQVEASAPRAYTGETGTDVARQFVYLADEKRAKPPGGADEAKADYSASKRDRYRFATLVVRKANLVVGVEYQNWREPSRRVMERDVVRVADEVLAQYA